MRIIYKVLTAVVTQLQTRGGVLHVDADYWLADLKKASEGGSELETRLAEVEEKLEFLAEYVGAKQPVPDAAPVPDPEPAGEPDEDDDPRFD